jgi:hypothetical protein
MPATCVRSCVTQNHPRDDCCRSTIVGRFPYQDGRDDEHPELLRLLRFPRDKEREKETMMNESVGKVVPMNNDWLVY